MKTKTKAPRSNRVKERIEVLEHHLQHAAQTRNTLQVENDRLQESQTRLYHLLVAERDELLARAAKVDAVAKSLGLRVDDGCSPSHPRIMNFTGRLG